MNVTEKKTQSIYIEENQTARVLTVEKCTNMMKNKFLLCGPGVDHST